MRGGDRDSPTSLAELLPLLSPRRVPALPVKNLNGTGPVHPALAGKGGPAAGRVSPQGDIEGPRGRARGWGTARQWEGWMDIGWTDGQHLSPDAGMTGILMCAAGLPVCLTRAPKPILHPPPVSKSDIKPVPGVNGICRKTKKKHLKKSKELPASLRALGCANTCQRGN